MDAADVVAAFGPLLSRQGVIGHDVADADPPARLEHAEGLGERDRLVDHRLITQLEITTSIVLGTSRK